MKETFSEAIKLKDGILYNLPYHQKRIDKTQARFGGEKIILSEVLSILPDYVKSGFFKCRIEYGILIERIEFIPYAFRAINKVTTIVDDSIDYRFKYTNRLRLEELLKKSGCDDIIVIRQGLITDSFSSNLVFESENGFFTPDSCLLHGTKRQSLLDSKKITEKRITVNDISSYSRIHFVNAMIDIEDNIYIDIKDIL